MVSYFHEKPHIDGAASGSKPGTPPGLCSTSPGSLCRYENSGSAADTGGSASGMDNRDIGSDAAKLECLDAQGKPGRIESVAVKAKAGTARPADAQRTPAAGTRPGEGAAGFRVAPVRLGWANAGGSPETDLRNNSEGSPGSVFNASSGLSAETRRLFICPGTRERCQEVPRGIKKNSKIWGLVKQSSLKTKPVLPCIPVWEEAGQRKASGCGFPQPANTIAGSISLVGSLRFWVDGE